MAMWHAAFVPPPDAVQEVLDVLNAVRASQRSQAARERDVGQRRSLFRRHDTVTRPRQVALLDVHDPRDVFVPLAGFGTLTRAEQPHVLDTVQRACASLGPVRVAFGGGLVLDPGVALPRLGQTPSRRAGETSALAVRLDVVDDDDELLAGVRHAVVHAVERTGIYCEARPFRPEAEVARTPDDAPLEPVTELLEALDLLQGKPFVLDAVSVLQWRLPGDVPTCTEVARVPLGS